MDGNSSCNLFLIYLYCNPGPKGNFGVSCDIGTVQKNTIRCSLIITNDPCRHTFTGGEREGKKSPLALTQSGSNFQLFVDLKDISSLRWVYCYAGRVNVQRGRSPIFHVQTVISDKYIMLFRSGQISECDFKRFIDEAKRFLSWPTISAPLSLLLL